MAQALPASALPTIDLTHEEQVRYWTTLLACNELLLRMAVAAIGSRTADVWQYVQAKSNWQHGKPAPPTPYPMRLLLG